MRVIAHDSTNHFLRELALVRLEPILLELSPHEIAFGNLELLALGVTGQRDDFDPVPQRFGHTVDVISCPDKNDLRKIERHVEVTIDEGVVLPRIEHFEQRARRIAAKIGAELIDLVQHEDRIARPNAA